MFLNKALLRQQRLRQSMRVETSILHNCRDSDNYIFYYLREVKDRDYLVDQSEWTARQARVIISMLVDVQSASARYDAHLAAEEAISFSN